MANVLADFCMLAHPADMEQISMNEDFWFSFFLPLVSPPSPLSATMFIAANFAYLLFGAEQAYS